MVPFNPSASDPPDGGSHVSNQIAGGATVSQDVTNKSFHERLMFGVRGIYNIRL